MLLELTSITALIRSISKDISWDESATNTITGIPKERICSLSSTFISEALTTTAPMLVKSVSLIGIHIRSSMELIQGFTLSVKAIFKCFTIASYIKINTYMHIICNLVHYSHVKGSLLKE